MVILVLLIISIHLISCSSEYTPKPKTFLRIDLPPKGYQKLQIEHFPYSFEYPLYAKIGSTEQTSLHDNKYALNIEFPSLHGVVFLAYRHIDSLKQLYAYIDSSYSTMFKIHEQKATGIVERAYEDNQNKVYGIVYEIKGSGVASPYQFYVTDNRDHFLRGALYFDNIPNNDSLAPVIHYIKEDIEHLISTIQWKKNTQ